MKLSLAAVGCAHRSRFDEVASPSGLANTAILEKTVQMPLANIKVIEGVFTASENR